jgi:hypothetical protein
VIVLAPLGVACASTPRGTTQAPVDLAIPPIGSMAGGGISTNGERSPEEKCTVRLAAGRIQKSAPGCYLDEHISKGEGLLHFACSGDGFAEAVFGPDRYRGKVERGEVQIEHSTELDWEDGCRWGTDAVITGTVVVEGQPTYKPLTWRYRDRVISGSDCSGLCTAYAFFKVSSAADPNAPDGSDDEEDDD